MDDRNREAVDYTGTRSSGGGVQLQLLQLEGLQENDYLLEVGCGALASAIPMMSFLKRGHYVGIDPNPWLMEQSLKIPENRKVVEERCPTFVQNGDFSAQSTGITFDYVFAHSIMSHAAHWQLSLFFENTSKVLKEGGKVVFSIRLTEPSEYGNEGALEESHSETWQYPGCSFFAEETVIREASKYFRKIERKKQYTALLISDNRGACHDWFVLTK
jgi:cyclopropane fatty-acyl-phospholipid synthase-like methyltransferase